MDKDSVWFCLAISLLAVGYVFGFSIAESGTEKNTIIFCMEKPKDCSIKYNYYKLQK